jgi:hypothetical protein
MPTDPAVGRPDDRSAKQSIASAVIASEAKQSIKPRKENGLLRRYRSSQ